MLMNGSELDFFYPAEGPVPRKDRKFSVIWMVACNLGLLTRVPRP